MKKLELEQLANRLIDIAETLKNLNKPEDFVKGRWYKGKTSGTYCKYSNSQGQNFGIELNGEIRNNIKIANINWWNNVTDFTELTELLKAEVIKRISKGKPIGVRDVKAKEINKFSGDYKKDYANGLGEMADYNPDTDTLYSIGYGITIVYENGVFATVQQEDKGAVLIEEAKKRGFKGDVYIESMNHKKRKVKLTYGKFIVIKNLYDKEGDYLYFGGQMIYYNAQWATIIQEPIIIDGKEVEIGKDCCYINTEKFTKYEIGLFKSLNPIFTEILKRMEEK